MYLISGITNSPIQSLTVPIPNLASANLTLNFRATQQMWFWDLSWGNFSVQGNALVNTPNLLRQWSELLPFGIGCSTQDGLDPTGQDTLNSGLTQLFLLEARDLPILAQTLYPGQ